MDSIISVFTFPLFMTIQKIPHSLMKVILLQCNLKQFDELSMGQDGIDTNNNTAISQSE